MNCNFAEKVSLLLDGELPAAEDMEQVKAHIAGCAECREMEKDFLYLRRQIKESAPALATTEAQSAFPTASRPAKVRFWKKRILLPAPVFVLLLLVLAAVGVWAIASSLDRTKETDVAGGGISGDAANKPPVQRQPPTLQNTRSEISLSRFDNGGRAEIYTIHRQSAPESEKSRSVQQ